MLYLAHVISGQHKNVCNCAMVNKYCEHTYCILLTFVNTVSSYGDTKAVIICRSMHYLPIDKKNLQTLVD